MQYILPVVYGYVLLPGVFLFIDFADAFSFFFRFSSGFFRLNTFGFFAFGFFFLFLQIFNEVELVTFSRVYLETVFFTFGQ